MESRSEALLRALANLHAQAPGVRGSAVINGDGLIMASYPPGWEGDIHDPTGGDHVAAMAAVVAGLAQQTMTRLAQGGVERVLIEGERGTVGIFPAAREVLLALLIDKEARLGLTFSAARQAAGQIRAIFSPVA